jgi:hypothetical protein
MANIDPNKYSANKDIKPESHFSAMAATGRIVLMLLGIIGLAIELFREDGWLKKGLAKLFESTTSMILIPVIIFTLWLLNRWISSSSQSETKRSGDLPMYLMMAVGAYYLFMLITTGSF